MQIKRSSPLPPTQTRSVTIVIPACNEEGNLERLFLFLEQTFEDLRYTLPVLLIDDGSSDNSPQILARLSEQYSFLQVVRHPQRRGVTQVWKTALSKVTTDWIVWGQADLESDPRTDIPLLLEACVSGVDAVAGWRQNRRDNKLMASSLANGACRLVFGSTIHDMNWIKIVRRDILAQLPVERVTHRYLLAVLSAQGYNVTEVPTPWHSRYSGESKFGFGRLFSSGRDFFFLLLWWLQAKTRFTYEPQPTPDNRKKVMSEI